MITFTVAGVIVALLVAGAIAGERRRLRQGSGGRGRRAGFGFISRRDLYKYK